MFNNTMNMCVPPFPVGLRFRPNDEELVEYYLYSKVWGINLPFVDYFIKDCDLYGEQEPGEIWKAYGGSLLNEDEDLYFFTKLKKKTPKGSRINRRVGAGAWQGEDAPKEILSGQSNRIGSKKRFRYEKENCEENGCWIMHEYTLDSSLSHENQPSNYVLCRIRKNPISGKSKKRKLNNVECGSYEASTGQEEESCNTDMTLLHKEASGVDPLAEIPEEDFCMLRKIFHADEFDNQQIGESSSSASVDVMTKSEQSFSVNGGCGSAADAVAVAASTGVDPVLPQICVLPPLPCEENVIVLSDDESNDWVAIDDLLDEFPQTVSEDSGLSMNELQILGVH